MNIWIHADDLGLSPAITNRILKMHDDGALNRASMIVNFPWFPEVVQAIQARPKLRTFLHLNIFEGNPLAPPHLTAPLQLDNGRFRFEFVSLWHAYLQADTNGRAALSKAVECEFEAQIQRYRQAFPNQDYLEVDSHVHFHMIPFVFDCLLSLASRHPIRRIRTIHEPFFIAKKGGLAPFGPNLLKHLLLNALTRRHAPRLAAKGIATNDHLIGILYSGHMTLDTAIAGLLKSIKNNPKEIEILFHPGSTGPNEKSLWPEYSYIYKFHSSPKRQREEEAVRSLAISPLLSQYQDHSTS